MKFLNQIIAAILLTFVIVFGINKLSDIIYKVETPKTAFKVESKTNDDIMTIMYLLTLILIILYMVLA